MRAVQRHRRQEGHGRVEQSFVEGRDFTRRRAHNPGMVKPADTPLASPKPTSARDEALAAYRALGYNRPPKSTPALRGRAVPVAHAASHAPTLAHLSQLAQDSQQRLLALKGLLPPPLLASLQGGPVEGSDWCVLVPNSAVGAKLRQFLPAIAAHLRSKGWDVQTIRLKVRVR
jgi:hypothetical protein